MEATIKNKITKTNRYTSYCNIQTSKEYANQVNNLLVTNQYEDPIPNQEKWNNTVTAITSAAGNTLGFKKQTKPYHNGIILDLSKQQKQLNIKTSATKNENLRKDLKKQRNRILTQIHNNIKKQESDKINNILKKLDAHKDSNQKMYHVIKKLKTLMLKAHLLINNLLSNNGDTLTANPKEQSRIIAEYSNRSSIKTHYHCNTFQQHL